MGASRLGVDHCQPIGPRRLTEGHTEVLVDFRCPTWRAAFLIHVLTDGAPIPEGLEPSLDNLLRGLLARDFEFATARAIINSRN